MIGRIPPNLTTPGASSVSDISAQIFKYDMYNIEI